jgi:hypothetical protein
MLWLPVEKSELKKRKKKIELESMTWLANNTKSHFSGV